VATITQSRRRGSAVDGPEAFGPTLLGPGTYVVRIDAFTELDAGYTLGLTFDPITTLGDGGSVTETGGSLAQGERDSFIVRPFALDAPRTTMSTAIPWR